MPRKNKTTGITGVSIIRRQGRVTVHWFASKRARELGYRPKTQLLWVGERIDGLDFEQFRKQCDLWNADVRAWLRKPRRARRSRAAFGKVYFVRAGDLIKIGFTGRLSGRLRALQSISPTRIALLGAIDGTPQFEARIHVMFRHLESHGEWFRAEPDLLAFIQEQIEKEGFPTAFPTRPENNQQLAAANAG